MKNSVSPGGIIWSTRLWLPSKDASFLVYILYYPLLPEGFGDFDLPSSLDNASSTRKRKYHALPSFLPRSDSQLVLERTKQLVSRFEGFQTAS